MMSAQDRLPAEQEIKQFVSEVTSASSQYGGESSISYTVSNLVGPCKRYPVYGDYGDTCVLRTYGPWWQMAPSAPKAFPRSQGVCLEDYVEVKFEKAVYPSAVAVYETYNPGAVVRISAGRHTNNGKFNWFTLWEHKGELAPGESRSRIFSPPIRQCSFPTQIIRLEFCHELLNYYTELDAVELWGRLMPLPPPSLFSSIQLPNFDKLSLADESITSAYDATAHFPFDSLPNDLLRLIVSYLDIQSLSRAAQVCRRFYEFCYDPLLPLHQELNMQPYWHTVDDKVLLAVQRRCTQLKRLNMSWCGSHSMIGQSAFAGFVSRCCAGLSCLRLACCPFVNDSMLNEVVRTCPGLTEVDLRSCPSISAAGFGCLSSLPLLERINLYRTSVDTSSVVAIVRKCNRLEHVNLGACGSVKNYDAVAIEIGHHCARLKSVDFWRAKTLTDVGLSALAEHCVELRELDLGWCHEIQCTTGVVAGLAHRCTCLVKLFLTANRTVGDRELNALAANCPDLEQLDVLGSNLVTSQAVRELLRHCGKLKFLDLSFCSGIDNRQVYEWSAEYARCRIKKSFQCS